MAHNSIVTIFQAVGTSNLSILLRLKQHATALLISTMTGRDSGKGIDLPHLDAVFGSVSISMPRSVFPGKGLMRRT